MEKCSEERDLGILAEHEPAMCPCGKEGKQPPGLDEGEHCQQVEEGVPSILLSTGRILPGVLCPELSFPNKRHEHSVASSA